MTFNCALCDFIAHAPDEKGVSDKKFKSNHQLWRGGRDVETWAQDYLHNVTLVHKKWISPFVVSCACWLELHDLCIQLAPTIFALHPLTGFTLFQFLYTDLVQFLIAYSLLSNECFLTLSYDVSITFVRYTCMCMHSIHVSPVTNISTLWTPSSPMLSVWFSEFYCSMLLMPWCPPPQGILTRLFFLSYIYGYNAALFSLLLWLCGGMLQTLL